MKLLYVFTIASIVFGTSATPELPTVENRNSVASPTIDDFELHPQKEAQPALKYSLLPTILEQKEGNSAVDYGAVLARHTKFFADEELQRSIADIGKKPLDDLRDPKAIQKVCSEWVYKGLRKAACCSSCDWQVPIFEEPFISVQYDWLVQSRSFARILAARARCQIANEDFDQAIETLQTGYALAEDVAEGPGYIHLLVGVAIKGIMDEQLECLIQQPKAPNLYWALASLPRPFLSVQDASRIELYILDLSFPELSNLTIDRLQERSPEFWEQQLAQLIRIIHFESPRSLDAEAIRLQNQKLAREYAESHRKQARILLALSGFDSDKVKKLPPVQAALLASIIEFEKQNQEVVKWSQLPYFMAKDGLQKATQKLEDSDDDKAVLGLAPALTPAVESVYYASVRSQRKTAVLQTLEAIRIYAAENSGDLPKQLSDLTIPAPLDPVSGKLFETEKLDGALRIYGDPLRGDQLDLHVEIVK